MGVYEKLKEISIHSPRMGRDILVQPLFEIRHYFNPLSPHGERPAVTRATAKLNISIHSPRMGRDHILHRPKPMMYLHFNPLSPHGERPFHGELLVSAV